MISKRQLFNSAKHSHKVYFPITGEIGEGRQRKKATGKVALITRLHEWHDDKTRYGNIVKTLMEGSSKNRDKAIHWLMQTFNAEVDLKTELDRLVEVMQEPVIEELVCHISDSRRCEGACFALMGILGKKGPRVRKTWGFTLRRALQKRIIGVGGADACAEGVMAWDTGASKLRRKAACLELLGELFDDNKTVCQEVVRKVRGEGRACGGGGGGGVIVNGLQHNELTANHRSSCHTTEPEDFDCRGCRAAIYREGGRPRRRWRGI